MQPLKWLLASWANFKEVCRIEVGHKIHTYFSSTAVGCIHSFACDTFVRMQIGYGAIMWHMCTCSCLPTDDL